MDKDNPATYQRSIAGREYNSQACQDLFVLEMLEHKRQGIYCEIGGADPFESNNSYLLELRYDWKGVSLEFDPLLAQRFASLRENPCLCQNATKFDYLEYFTRAKFPPQIDYLSLDIEPASNTFAALQRIPFALYRPAVGTFEHERYIAGEQIMLQSRSYLSTLGYQIVAENVHCFGRDIEDWWIDPLRVPEARWGKFRSQCKEFKALFER